MSQFQPYRRSLVISAAHFVNEIAPPPSVKLDTDPDASNRWFVVTDHNRRMPVELGDWIVAGKIPDRGWPLSDDIFRAAYEPAWPAPPAPLDCTHDHNRDRNPERDHDTNAAPTTNPAPNPAATPTPPPWMDEAKAADYLTSRGYTRTSRDRWSAPDDQPPSAEDICAMLTLGRLAALTAAPTAAVATASGAAAATGAAAAATAAKTAATARMPERVLA